MPTAQLTVVIAVIGVGKWININFSQSNENISNIELDIDVYVVRNTYTRSERKFSEWLNFLYKQNSINGRWIIFGQLWKVFGKK